MSTPQPLAKPVTPLPDYSAQKSTAGPIDVNAKVSMPKEGISVIHGINMIVFIAAMLIGSTTYYSVYEWFFFRNNTCTGADSDWIQYMGWSAFSTICLMFMVIIMHCIYTKGVHKVASEGVYTYHCGFSTLNGIVTAEGLVIISAIVSLIAKIVKSSVVACSGMHEVDANIITSTVLLVVSWAALFVIHARSAFRGHQQVVSGATQYIQIQQIPPQV